MRTNSSCLSVRFRIVHHCARECRKTILVFAILVLHSASVAGAGDLISGSRQSPAERLESLKGLGKNPITNVLLNPTVENAKEPVSALSDILAAQNESLTAFIKGDNSAYSEKLKKQNETQVQVQERMDKWRQSDAPARQSNSDFLTYFKENVMQWGNDLFGFPPAKQTKPTHSGGPSSGSPRHDLALSDDDVRKSQSATSAPNREVDGVGSQNNKHQLAPSTAIMNQELQRQRQEQAAQASTRAQQQQQQFGRGPKQVYECPNPPCF